MRRLQLNGPFFLFFELKDHSDSWNQALCWFSVQYIVSVASCDTAAAAATTSFSTLTVHIRLNNCFCSLLTGSYCHSHFLTALSKGSPLTYTKLFKNKVPVVYPETQVSLWMLVRVALWRKTRVHTRQNKRWQEEMLTVIQRMGQNEETRIFMER